MRGTPVARLICILAGIYLSACQGGVRKEHRIPELKSLVRPERVTEVLGRPGQLQDIGDAPSTLRNVLDQSTISRAEYQTETAPLRLLRARMIYKPRSDEEAGQEFYFVKDEFASLPGVTPLPELVLGNEAAAFGSEDGRNFRLAARKERLIVTLHVRGDGAPADQIAAMKALAEDIFAGVLTP
jgi:hypothetical protein